MIKRIAFVFGCLAASASVARAQDVLCPAEAGGVPSLQGPPNFATIPATLDPNDDPGWNRSLLNNHGTSASYARARVIYDETPASPILYLLFEGEIDLGGTTSPATTAELWVGFKSGTEARLLRVTLAGESAVVKKDVSCLSSGAGCTGTLTEGYELYKPATTAGRFAKATAAEHAALRPQLKVTKWRAAGHFNVGIELPLTAVLPAKPDPFEFWYDFATGPVGNVVVARWPFGASAYDGTPDLGGEVPSPTTFGTMVRTPTAAFPCPPGVIVERTEIGVARAAAGALTQQIIGWDGTLSPAGPANNVFIARPTMSDGTALPASYAANLEGRIRLADWGSSGIADFGSVHLKTGGPEWVPLTGGEVASGTWTLSGADRCTYGIPSTAGGDTCTVADATRNRHQCFYAEVRVGAGGAGSSVNVPITKSSEYRNTNFVNLSEFSRIASISARGEKLPVGASDAEFYLYVDKRNMKEAEQADPAVQIAQRLKVLSDAISKRFSPPADVVARLEARIERGDQRAAAELKRLIEDARAEMPAQTRAQLASIESALQANDILEAVKGLELDVVEKVVPTMLIHTFRKTGETVYRGGQRVNVLAAQSAFGYYALHRGEIVGWDAVIDGAEVLGNDWYRLVIPANDVGKINTRIGALESAKEPRLIPDPGWTPRAPDPCANLECASGQVCKDGKCEKTCVGCCKCQVSPADLTGTGALALLISLLGLAFRRRQRGRA